MQMVGWLFSICVCHRFPGCFVGPPKNVKNRKALHTPLLERRGNSSLWVDRVWGEISKLVNCRWWRLCCRGYHPETWQGWRLLVDFYHLISFKNYSINFLRVKLNTVHEKKQLKSPVFLLPKLWQYKYLRIFYITESILYASVVLSGLLYYLILTTLWYR